jgi:hypothetical protein
MLISLKEHGGKTNEELQEVTSMKTERKVAMPIGVAPT